MNADQTPPRILRIETVTDRTALSKSSIYALVARGAFPRPIRLAPTDRIGWLEADVSAWIAARAEASA